MKSVRDIQIIQGGMGIGVSLWPLAKAVSKAGGLGVVSGVAIHVLVARVLQIGDPGGHIRRAAAAFPVPSIAREAISAYFVEGGKPREKPFKAVPIFTINPSQKLINLNVFANFAAVWLAKEGHD
ncbi:MAG: nitronate monooxygenase, partial [Armatimonadetes bacterium]|nr:nitronate monooxygenase [Armatimonadota bacterium]